MPTHRSASTCSKLFEILLKKNIKLNVVFRATLALKEHQKLVGLNWFKFERRLECDVEGQAAVNPTGACSSGHASDSKNNPLQQLVHTSRKLLCKAIKILKSAFLLKKKEKKEMRRFLFCHFLWPEWHQVPPVGLVLNSVGWPPSDNPLPK